MSIPVELMDQNPWWRKPDSILKDKYILALTKSKVRWEPRLKYKFDLNTDAVYALRGPRQVGKTTLLKDIIKHLIDSGTQPRNIF